MSTAGSKRALPARPGAPTRQKAEPGVLVAADVPYSRTLLKQTLRQAGCQVTTADSLPEALDALAQRPYELLVIDLARPAGSGEQLLLRVRVAGNRVPVLVLLANVESDVLRRLANLQPVGFLVKPLRIEVLQKLLPLSLAGDAGLLRQSAELTRTVRKQYEADISEESIAAIEQGGPVIDEQRLKAVFGRLPLLPHVVARIIQISGNETAAATDLAEVISSDPRLSGMLLRVVNSAYFGFSRRVASIPEATVILGTEAIKTLTVGAAVCNFFGGKSDLLDRARLWRHALAVAAGSRALAVAAGYRDVEEVFAAGLLHDFGRLVLERYLPKPYAGVLRRACNGGISLLEAETEVLGVSHAWVSGWLARQWNLPPLLREAMAWHHEPESADGPTRLATAIVNVADHLVNGAGAGGVEGLAPSPAPGSYALESIGLEPDALAELLPAILAHAQTLEQQLSPAASAS